MAQDDYGIPVSRLYPKKSRKGNVYFSGPWGDVSVALVQSKFRDSQGRKYSELFLNVRSQKSESLKVAAEPQQSGQTDEDDESPF